MIIIADPIIASILINISQVLIRSFNFVIFLSGNNYQEIIILVGMSDKSDLINFFKNQQEKYVYYIIALCVACIGYSVNASLGMKLNLKMIPLGFAVLAWTISIYCGLLFMRWVMSSTYANIGMLEMLEGKHKFAGTHPEKIKIGVEVVTEILEKNSSITSKVGRNQDYSFYTGTICFIIWRIVEMMP